MCQQVTGPQITLKRRTAWKVFMGKPTALEGIYYPPDFVGGFFKRDHVYTCAPQALAGLTYSGYHVFATAAGAEAYRVTERDQDLHGRLYVIRVRVWGAALPFECMDHKGWAVENLLIPSQKKVSL